MEEIKTIKKQAASAVIFLVGKRILFQVIITSSNVFLYRLLFPSDFGTFAIMSSIYTFFVVFSDLGFSQSLIQKKEKPSQREMSTVFTSQLILGFLILATIFFASGAIGEFFKLGSDGQLLFRVYSLVFIIRPFSLLPAAILERNLEYKKIVLIELLTVLSSSLATVAFAFFGFGVFSFVYGVLIGALAGVSLYFLALSWPIKIFLDVKILKELSRFGLPFQMTMFTGLFYGPLILLYLGKRVGTENLGYYLAAGSLSVATLAISDIVNRIVFPLGSRLQDEAALLRKITEKAVILVSLTALPIIVVLILTAREIIHYVYTDKWLPALPAMYLGLLQMGIMAFTGIFSQLLLSRGEAKVIRNIGVFWAILTWVLAPFLIDKFNFIGMSLTNLVVSASGIWLIFRFKKEVTFSFWENFYPYFLSAFACGIVIFILKNILPKQFLSLIFALICGGVFYLVLVLALRRKVLLSNFKILLLSLVRS